jgi:hypothetical protein
LPETLKEQPEDNKTAQPRQDNVSMMQIKEDLIIMQQPEHLSSNTIVQRARGNSTTVLGEYREPLPRKKSPLKIEDELRGSSVTKYCPTFGIPKSWPGPSFFQSASRLLAPLPYLS